MIRGLMASAGQWLLRKAQARPAATYFRGASIGRLTDDWMPTAQAMDRILRSDLVLLRDRSRQFAEDNPHMKGFLRDLRLNVVGIDETGIPLQARVTLPDGRTLARDVNQRIEAGWRAWGVPEYASADGRDSWADLQNLYITTLAVDGEVLWREGKGADNPFGFEVELLDGALIDEKYNRPAGNGANEIRLGVELTPRGRPVAFHVWSAYPGDHRIRERKRLAVADGYHLDFVKWRQGQTRGIPWATPVLFDWKMLDGYTEAEVVQARAAANNGGFFVATGEDAHLWQTKQPSPTDPTQAESDNLMVMESEPGLYRQLPPGLQYQPIEPTHPNSDQPAFQKVMLQWIARGLGPSYTSLSGDFENTNYSSGRMGLLPERDYYRGLARWMTVRFHRPVKATWMQMALLAGALELPTLNPADYAAGRWLYRGWPWIDPLNDMQAAGLEVQMGLNSLQRLCAERGRDFEEIMQERQEEEAIAARYGVTLGKDISVEETKVALDDPTKQKDGAAPDEQDAKKTVRKPAGAGGMRVVAAPGVR